jgi:CRISPR-associated protein Cas2
MSRGTWYLVSYDVRDPERLRRTAAVLKGYGDRLQYSVFRCRLSNRQKERMLWELAKVMDSDDALLLVPLCRVCVSRIEVRGTCGWLEEPPLVVL